MLVLFSSVSTFTDQLLLSIVILLVCTTSVTEGEVVRVKLV